MYEASLARKSRTEEYLRSLGVPVNPHLPRVEDESDTRLRPAIEVAKRSIALFSVSAVGFGASSERAIKWLGNEELWDSLSPQEQTFLLNRNPSQQDLANASWRVESLWTLLWCLGKIESLEFPTDTCDVDLIQELMPPPDTSCQKFCREATVRTLSEVLDQTDLVYRIHWAVVEARLKGQPTPCSLNSSVVYERHYALNWLIFYADEWDNVTTDT
jgi:hypothetical protein